MVMRMQMEQILLSQFQRLPGLRSEYAGLETLMGRDEDFGPEDYLNCTARFNVLLIHKYLNSLRRQSTFTHKWNNN